MLDEFIYEHDFMKPNWYKLYVFDLLENNDIKYNQIVVDADTIVHPNCPNFFEMTENKFCAVLFTEVWIGCVEVWKIILNIYLMVLLFLFGNI